jgi:DNA-binding transcriptional regulator YhcF (GntR family)
MPTPQPLNFKKYQDRNMERDIETLKEFHRVLRRSLRPPVYSVFCAIEDHAGTTPPDGLPAFTCFASDKTLADEAHVSRATVIRAVEELTGLGLITVQDRGGYTSLIWPLVSNAGYITYMKEQEIRDAQKATCSTEQQGVLQKATGGVAQSDTNETKLKKPNNETNKDMAVSNEPGPRTIDLPDILPPKKSIKVLLPTVEATKPGPVSSNGQDRGGAKISSHIPPVLKPVPKPSQVKPSKPPKEPDPTLKDDRLILWRQYADKVGYKPWPNPIQRCSVIEKVPLEALSRWEKVLQYWTDHDYKMQNIPGMLEVFLHGVGHSRQK